MFKPQDLAEKILPASLQELLQSFSQIGAANNLPLEEKIKNLEESTRNLVRFALEHLKEFTQPSPFSKEEGIFLHHPGKKFLPVAKEILSAYPEDAFCFLNAGKLRERVRLIQKHFLPENPQRVIAYAVKANPKKMILEILNEEGLTAFDCASSNEIERVLAVNPEALALYNHPIKKKRDILDASRRGVFHFTAQTQKEAEKILHNADLDFVKSALEIAIRLQTLNPKAGVNLSEKYGAPTEEVKKILKFLQEIRFVEPGVSFHTGSQNHDTKSYGVALDQVADLLKEVGPVKTLNIGGGLPVNYHPEENFNIAEYLQIISRGIREKLLGLLKPEPRIITELGRSIIAEAVDLTIPILSIEKRDGKNCLYMDDGLFTSFSDGIIHGWKYNFQGLNKDYRPMDNFFKGPYEVFGRTCDSGDKLGTLKLPLQLKDEDFLWVSKAGAYLDCQGSGFNGFSPPKYVIYNEEIFVP